MAWTAPRTYTAGEIITASILNTHIRDNERYLKGLDGIPTIESGLTIDNTDGDERLLLPLLSTAECSTVLNAEGEVAHDEQTHRIKVYDGTGVRSIVTDVDVDDTPANGATTDPVSSNWAFDHEAAADPHTGYVLESLLDVQGDLIVASADNTPARLGIGGNATYLKSDGTTASWAAGTFTNFLKTETRALDAISGDVAYTGYGFQPSALIIFANQSNTKMTSWGFGDVNLSEMCIYQKDAAGSFAADTGNIIYLDEASGTKSQSAVLKTLDADGFTLTWTRTGTTTAGTGTLIVLALK